MHREIISVTGFALLLILALTTNETNAHEFSSSDESNVQQQDRTRRAGEPVLIYVSPKGSDSNTGKTTSSPLKTLKTALTHSTDASIKKRDVVVELMEGFHDLESTLRIVNTDPRSITLRAYRGQAVHITGGKRISHGAFKSVIRQGALKGLPQSSRNNIYQVKLSEAGITNFGSMEEYGYGKQRTAPLEVFENGVPMTVARYPNKGYINVGSYSDKKSFTYVSDRPKGWKNEKDVWAHGFWRFGWADLALKVTSHDAQKKTITLSRDTTYGITKGHYHMDNPARAGYHEQGGYFKFVNVLSELDEPGEYFVDRENGILYVWPINSRMYRASDVVYASIIDTCIEIGHNSKNIRMEGITIEACRHIGIDASLVSDLAITKSQIRNTGGYALKARGQDIKITMCNFENTDGGIYINGGETKTLQASGNVIADNKISKFGRAGLTTNYAIYLIGVGSHANHNAIWDGPYTGIRWQGNDHKIEYNNIYDTCRESSDCGAVHSGRSFIWRGNQIQYNHIHNTKRLAPGTDVRGIMLDDQYSGAIIKYNVFYDNDVHVNIGGGRDTIIQQNVFFNTSLYSIQMDARGENGKHTKNLVEQLKTVPYNSALWSTKYPEIEAITTSSNPGLPEGNIITENIFYSVRFPNFNNNKFSKDWFKIDRNLYTTDAQNFRSPRIGDFRPTPRSQAAKFAAEVKFKQPVLATAVGPRYPVGPMKQAITTPGRRDSSEPSPDC